MTSALLAGLIGIFVIVKLAFFSSNRLAEVLSMLPLIVLGYIAANNSTQFGKCIETIVDIVITIVNSVASLFG